MILCQHKSPEVLLGLVVCTKFALTVYCSGMQISGMQGGR